MGPIHGETRAQFSARAKREGTWDDFKRDRGTLIHDYGMVTAEATYLLRERRYFPGCTLEDRSRDLGELLEEHRPGLVKKEVVLGDRDLAVLEAKPPVSDHTAVRWALNNIARKNIRVESCPSLMAWQLLQDMQSAPGLRHEVAWKVLLPRLLPTKSELDRAMNMRDDGSEVFGVLGRLEGEMGLEDE